MPVLARASAHAGLFTIQTHMQYLPCAVQVFIWLAINILLLMRVWTIHKVTKQPLNIMFFRKACSSSAHPTGVSFLCFVQ
jgi:hypothetical protein